MKLFDPRLLGRQKNKEIKRPKNNGKIVLKFKGSIEKAQKSVWQAISGNALSLRPASREIRAF